MANVVAVGASRVDVEVRSTSSLGDQVTKHPLRGRRTADIAHADEKYGFGWFPVHGSKATKSRERGNAGDT
jgi:hypothetical protein